MHTKLADRFGQVTAEMCAYYRERALGGAALLIIENAFIDDAASRAEVGELAAHDNACSPGLARLAEIVHEAGALAGLQIAHAGRQRFVGTAPIVAPSRIPWEALHAIGAPVPHELTIEEIAEIVAAFGRAAQRAKDAGFDLVEVHAAHGYLAGEFLSPHTNRRTDMYGGSLTARQRFVREVLASVRKAVGREFPVTMRLSASEYLEDGISLDDTLETAVQLEGDGVAALDISAGTHHSMEAQVQPMYFPRAFNAEAARAVRERINIPISVGGSITTATVAADVLGTGAADFVRLARPLLADPYFPRKVLEGRPDDIRPCIRCNDCLDRGLRLQRSVVCSVNFSCGREDRYAEMIPRADRARSVAVVGGGPSGLETARIASLRGHDVTLYEGDSLGGMLNEACVPDFKADLRVYRDYLIRQIRGRVEVQETTATVEKLNELRPDVVVVACGAVPSRVDVTGVSQERIVDYVSVLRGAETGTRLIVLGGDQFSAELAVFLAGQGKQVTIVHPRAAVADEVGAHTRTPLLGYLAAYGVRVVCEAHLHRCVDGAVIVATTMGDEVNLSFDTIITTGLEPDAGVIGEFAQGPWEVEYIGDCVKPRRILDAVREANLVARRL